jgi:hypothetical protein
MREAVYALSCLAAVVVGALVLFACAAVAADASAAGVTVDAFVGVGLALGAVLIVAGLTAAIVPLSRGAA